MLPVNDEYANIKSAFGQLVRKANVNCDLSKNYDINFTTSSLYTMKQIRKNQKLPICTLLFVSQLNPNGKIL